MARLFSQLILPTVVLLASPMEALRAQAPSAAPSREPKKTVTIGDTYLQGSLIMIDGDKARKRGDFAAAYFKYRDARDIFDSVHASEPSWNPEVVEYRRKKIRTEMEDVRQQEIARRKAGGEISDSGIIGPKPSDRDTKEEHSSIIDEPSTTSTPRSTTAVMNERVKALRQQIDSLEKKNEDILKSLGAKEAEAFRTKKDLLEAKDAENRTRQRLVEAHTKLDTAAASEKRKNATLQQEVEALRTQLATAQQKLEEANTRTTRMTDELTAALTQVKTLTKERDDLKSERDQMAAIIAGGEDLKSMDRAKIVEENARLKRQLTDTEAKVTALTNDKEANRTQIATLKEQVRATQESLAAMQKENEDYRQQLASVTSKLDATQTRLAEAAAGGLPEGEASAENSILREIVLQQLKQQYRREQARQNLIEDLSKEGVLEGINKLGVQSEEILRALNEMAAPVALTKEQRAAITSSQITKLMTGGEDTELFVLNDSTPPAKDPEVKPDSLPEPTGAADKATLGPELKAYANAAEEQFKLGDYQSAENNFRKILLVEPRNLYALCNLGVVQLRLEQNDAAAVTLKTALAYNYDTDRGHYLLGVAHLRKGDLQEASTEIREGLKINPKNSPAHYVMGYLANKEGKRTEAITEFQQAITIDSANAAAHHALAVLYYKSGRPAESREHYQIAVKNGAPRDKDFDMLFSQ